MSTDNSEKMKEKMSSSEIKEEKEKNEKQQKNETAVKEENNAKNVKDSGADADSQVDEQAADQHQADEKDVRISELEEELKTVKDTLLRKAAELENVRKRVQRERIQLFDDAKAAAIEDFMPISDDLLRTLKAAEESKIEDSFLQGVEMVNKKFLEVLNKNGVVRIDEANVPFDIDLHDAMLKQPATDENTESGMVLQVLESGYKIGNRTVKHAKVIVSE